MNQLVLISKIAPEVKELVERRHMVLQTISFAQPVGRRALASALGWPERMVRKEIDFLRETQLIVSDAAGMMVTPAGEHVLEELKRVVKEFHGLTELEKELQTRLNLKRVIIVPGDSDQDDSVKKEIATVTARWLAEELRPGDVLAVTGGTTLAEVAMSFPPIEEKRDVIVVPARGGLGEEVELQANTVAAGIATHLGGSYRLLHVPDDLGKDAIASIAGDPKIKALMELIRSARIVLHGIGTAEEMAKRRGLAQEYVEILNRRKAVGEAFGYYFDRDGNIVFTTSSVGLRFEDLEGVELVVAVGGGRSKADAALAVLSTRHQDVYITDEGAATEMLSRLQGRK